jgi:predicted nucleic acid-binding protein
VARCTPTDLEAGYRARSLADLRRRRDERAAWPFVATDQEVLDRAVEVQGMLAGRGEHRSAPIPDLLIAAAAVAAGLVVLHYDRDYDRIAEATGQPVEWIVPAARPTECRPAKRQIRHGPSPADRFVITCFSGR